MFLSKFCKSIGFQIIFYIKYKYFCIYNIYYPIHYKTLLLISFLTYDYLFFIIILTIKKYLTFRNSNIVVIYL